jgi:putative spermidine/putrescine transport system permease protein
MRPRLAIVLLVLPGAGFIFLFLAVALTITACRASASWASAVSPGSPGSSGWRSSTGSSSTRSCSRPRSAIGSAFGTLLLAYPLALFLRRRRAGARFIGSVVKIPLFVPALVAAFLILNTMAFHGVINGVLLGFGADRPAAADAERQVRMGRAGDPGVEEPAVPAPRPRLRACHHPHGYRGRRPQPRAGPWQVLRHIILPLSMPGILIAVVLVFIMTFGDFAITRIAGPIYPTSLAVLMHTKALT